MKQALHTVVFAVVLGVTCSLLLVGASSFTRPYRQANEKGEEVRNILAALGAPVSPGTSVEDLLQRFERDVREVTRAGSRVYQYVPDGTARHVAVAIPFQGPGVWGPIEGVLAMEPDLETIRGIRFYKQEETPGLGGEIASDWFQSQFQGKSVRAADGTVNLRVRKAGEPGGRNAVDAITGATMTSERVETMLNTTARRLQEVE